MDHDRFYNEVIDLFSIVYRINRSFNRSGENDLFCALPHAQLHALVALYRHDALNMGKLADYLLVPRQQLTKIVDALVEKGLVERSSDPRNRRYVIIVLTDAGKRYLQALMGQRPNIVTRLLKDAGEAETERFLDAIVTIKDVLAKINT